MARWVRVAVDLEENLKVAGLAEALGVELDVAIARCVRLWGRVSLHRPETGQVGDVPDRTLETWANWRGTPGAFARAFRAAFQDPDGTLHDWWEWNGAALTYERRERDRRRHTRSGDRRRADTGADSGADATARRGADTPRADGADSGARMVGFGASSGGGADSGADSGARTAQLRTDGRTDGLSSSSSNQPASPRATVSESRHTAAARPYVAEPFWPDLDELLDAVPDPRAWAAEIQAHGQGMPGHGPARTAHQLGTAIRDYLGSGAAREARPSLAHFRGFVARGGRPEPAVGEGDVTESAALLRQIKAREGRTA